MTVVATVVATVVTLMVERAARVRVAVMAASPVSAHGRSRRKTVRAINVSQAGRGCVPLGCVPSEAGLAVSPSRLRRRQRCSHREAVRHGHCCCCCWPGRHVHIFQARTPITERRSRRDRGVRDVHSARHLQAGRYGAAEARGALHARLDGSRRSTQETTLEAGALALPSSSSSPCYHPCPDTHRPAQPIGFTFGRGVPIGTAPPFSLLALARRKREERASGCRSVAKSDATQTADARPHSHGPGP
jgi:hypothetical protein